MGRREIPQVVLVGSASLSIAASKLSRFLLMDHRLHRPLFNLWRGGERKKKTSYIFEGEKNDGKFILCPKIFLETASALYLRWAWGFDAQAYFYSFRYPQMLTTSHYPKTYSYVIHPCTCVTRNRMQNHPIQSCKQLSWPNLTEITMLASLSFCSSSSLSSVKWICSTLSAMIEWNIV